MGSGKLECDDAAIKCLFERGMLNGLLRMERMLELRGRRVMFGVLGFAVMGGRGVALQTEQMRADILRFQRDFRSTIVAYRSKLPARIYR
jgi:hypothetical protein